MKPAQVRAALHATGLKPQTSRLLAHMADVADDRGLFYEKRERTAHLLTVHRDTIKAALRELIEAGYVTEVRAARTGRNTRTLQLAPNSWVQPESLGPNSDRWPPSHGAEHKAPPREPDPDCPARFESADASGPAQVREAMNRARAAVRETAPDGRSGDRSPDTARSMPGRFAPSTNLRK